MIKTFGLLHKRHDISQDRFHAHWRGPHAIEALKLTSVIRRYVQNHKSATPFPGFEAPCDGSPEVWMDDLDAAGQLNAIPEYLTGAYWDEPNFMRQRSGGVLVSESVVVDGPPTAKTDKLVKVLAFLKRQPDLSHNAFVELWMSRETPLLAGGNHVRRWVRSPALMEAYQDAEPSYDGVEELWWDDEAAFKKDARKKSTKAELAKLIDLGATTAMFVDENRVYWQG